jgi:hypothetical protein
MLSNYRILGRFQHAIEPSQHNHWKHDEPILRGAVGATQAVGDFPDFSRNDLVFGKQPILL